MRLLSCLVVPLFAISLAGSSATAGPLPSGSFEVQSPDDSGGGWIINHLPGLGDRLWGCTDLVKVEECKQVYLGDWVAASTLEFLHISEGSMKAWVKITVPVMGDYLLACEDPKGAPKCTPVELDLRPPLASLTREWPSYPCPDGCPGAAAAAGGPMGGLMGGSGAPKHVIAPASRGDLLISAALKVPGPVNLYACRNLEKAPECQLSIPDFLAVDRENIGFKKYDEIDLGSGRVGIEIQDVDEDTAAERSKFREGDVIVRVNGFDIKSKAHFKGMLMQWPATYAFEVELESGEFIEILPLRKPKK